jgi:hypothetical protein
MLAQRARERDALLAALERGCSTREADCASELSQRIAEWNRETALLYVATSTAVAGEVTLGAVQRALDPDEAVLLTTGARAFWIERGRIETATSTSPLTPWSERLSALRHLYIVPEERPPPTLDRRLRSWSLLPHAGWLVERPAAPSASARIIIAGDESTEDERAWLRAHLEVPLASISTSARALLSPGATIDLFHFAGHGFLTGEGAWSSHLSCIQRSSATKPSCRASPYRIGASRSG